MKKTKLTRSLLAACSIVALSAVMYGCTHSSGPSQTELDAANEATAAAAAKADVDAAASATAAEEAAAASATAAEEAAAASATAAEEAAAASATAAEEAAAASATAAEEAAAASATAAEEAAAAAATAAEEAAAAAATAADDAEAARQAAQDEADRLQAAADTAADAADAAAAMAHSAKLGKLAEAIGAVDSEALAAHVRVSGIDDAGLVKPTTAADGDAPHAISGWNGSSYSVTDDGATDGTDGAPAMTTVYDNKEAGTSVAFSKMWGAQEDATSGTYVFVAADHGKYVDMMGLPTNVNHDGVPVGPVNGVRGTFNGVAGKFTSETNNTLLTVGVNTNGVPAWTGNLNFTPDSGTSMVMQEDSEYLSLGWWLSMDADGVIDDVMVAGWSSGAPYEIGDFTALEGKATFQGIAVGKYTHKTINSIYGGHFNADAELVANFAATADDGTLTGTISGFMQDGQSIGSGWKVELGAAATGVPLAFDPMMGAGMAATGVVDTENGALGTFGNQKTMGTWNATFQDGSIDGSRNDTLPGAVTGTFHVGQEGHPINMVGAFAASNQEADQPDN